MSIPQPPPSRSLLAPFRRVGQWLYYLPRSAQAALVALVILAVAAGLYYARAFAKDRDRDREAAAAWQDFEAASRKTDTAAMTAALDRLLAVRPDDPMAARRKAALQAGSAGPDDPELAVVFLEHHVQADRLPEAAREAKTVLTRFPKDWLSHCVLAHHALQIDKDRDLAARRLGELPDPEDPAARVGPGGLLYALRLYAGVDRDASPLRAVIVRRLLPHLRGPTAAGAPPAVQIQLIECYLEAFAGPNPPLTELAGYWAAVSRLADVALSSATAAGDVPTLVRLGSVGGRLGAVLILFRDGAQIDSGIFEAESRHVLDRVRQAWQAAQAKDPARPEPYRGLAVAAIREKDYAGAVRALQEGLAACGERPELLDLMVTIRSRAGNAADAMEIAWAAAERAGNDPVKWCLAANAAIAANRHDRAIEACQNARKPPHERHHWACTTEAALWLRTGDREKTLAVLGTLGDEAVRSDPLLAELHARALTWPDAVPQLEAAFGKLQHQPAVRASFLRGALARRFPRDRGIPVNDWVVEKATAALAEWPSDAPLLRVTADALFRRADYSVVPDGTEARLPKWNPDAVRTALRAYDALPSTDRGDTGVVVAVAVLQLKGQNDAAGALRTLAPIRAVEDDPTTHPAMLEALGAAYLGTGRTVDALRVLRQSVQRPDGTGGCYLQLALAYHANRQPFEAQAALRHAEARISSDRERIELVAAKLKLQREAQ